jgi:hypothetical protein
LHLDLVNDPYRVQQVEPDARTMQLCTEAMYRRTSGQSADLAQMQALSNFTDLPVALEVACRAKNTRKFLLPANISVSVRERSYNESGVGGALWGAGIGLSIMLAHQRSTPYLRGLSVLELGSGVGLSGITCAMHGATTTLSDWGQLPDHRSSTNNISNFNQEVADIPIELPAAASRAAAEEKREGEENEEDKSEFDLPAAGGGGSRSVGGSGRGAVEEAQEILRKVYYADGGQDMGALKAAVQTMMDKEPKDLLENLDYSLSLNGLTESSCSVTRLDWHASLRY